MLPAGYVVMTKKERAANKAKKDKGEEEDQETLEEQIERERAALPSEGLTPVTKESFAAWKIRRAEQKQKALEDKMKADELKAAQGRAIKKNSKGVMNGRALFTYNPDLFKDDEAAQPAEKQIEEKKEEAAVDEQLFAAEEVDEDVDFDWSYQ